MTLSAAAGLAVSTITAVAGSAGSGDGGDGGLASAALLNSPDGVAVNNGSGTLLIADTGNSVIREVTPGTQGLSNGVIATLLGGNQPVYHNPLSGPADLAIDSTGDVFIADTDNNEIDEVDPVTGAETVVAGAGTAGYSGDGGRATAPSSTFLREWR